MKYIVGGGIAGLILGYYNPEYIVISKDVGGQITAKKWSLGIKALHKDEYSTRLLKDLKLKAKTKVLKIGYNDNGWVEQSDEFRQKYYNKSRATKGEFTEKCLSGGKKEIEIYDIDIEKIVQSLKNKQKIISSNVVKVNTDEKYLILDNGDKLYYEKLVSTIPAPIFFRLASFSLIDFKYEMKTFVLIDCNPHKFVKKYDYVYFAGYELYHRITKCRELASHCVFEFVGEISPESIVMIEARDIKTIKIGQIINDLNITEKEGVEFVGRYAQWQHGILINDVIKRSLEIAKI